MDKYIYIITVSIKLPSNERRRQYQILDKEKRQSNLPTYYNNEDAAKKDCDMLKTKHNLNIYVTPCLPI